MKTINIDVSDELYSKLEEIAVSQYKNVGILATDVLAEFAVSKQEDWGEDRFEKAFTR